MTVCVDTNVLIQARAASHPFGVILDGFLFGMMNWAVSNRVLTEYEEIITDKAGAPAWATVARFVELIGMSGNLVMMSPHLTNAGYKPQPITPHDFINRYRGLHLP